MRNRKSNRRKLISKLEGKVAVITGGNSGIGLATAQRFVAEGAYVFITGRRQGELDAAVKQIGKSITAVQGDVSNLADLDRLYATVKQQHAPIAHEGFFATHFFTVRDQEQSKDFYVRILGGKVIKAENPCYIKLANTWIILNSGGGPTPDKPEVLLETPSDPNRVNSFLNLRVADIWACYKQWGDKGAFFLTEPLDNHGWEWRCYMRDPDGYLIEVGQYTQIALDRFNSYAG
jgi:NAD(P)-dependent dehydrogenase (short-subunit alcohol dehydrogenase family)